MRFEVPQFIEIEDKIFGPLTWRQFLYLGGGVGAAVVIFLTLGWVVFAIVGLPLALLAGALSFYPVNNRPFSFFLEAVVNYITGDRLYLWRSKEEAVYKITSESDRETPPAMPIIRAKKANDISSLARKLELQAIQKQQ